MRVPQFLPIALLLILAGSISLPAFHEGGHDDAPDDWNFNVSKNGEVSIRGDVTIGNRLIKKGMYMLTHEAEGTKHVFVLAQVDKKKDASLWAIIQIDTRFVPASGVVKNSRFFSKKQLHGSYEVIRIQLVGENGDHVVTK
jgi:hypothetical protein